MTAGSHAMHAFTDLHHACAAHGTILFTITVLDPARDLCWRAYTSHPEQYPAQGTKPLTHDAWHSQVIAGRETFVANSAAAFETVFFDHALITSLGLGSAVNIPVSDDGGQVLATVNLLAEAGHFTQAKLGVYQALVGDHRLALLAAIRAA
jgi:hypothetical protein